MGEPRQASRGIHQVRRIDKDKAGSEHHGVGKCPRLQRHELRRRGVEVDEPVLVDFTATWCGPCKALSPIVDQVADEMAGKSASVSWTSTMRPSPRPKLGIHGVPTLMVFKSGQRAAQLVGLTTKQKRISPCCKGNRRGDFGTPGEPGGSTWPADGNVAPRSTTERGVSASEEGRGRCLNRFADPNVPSASRTP